MWKVYQEILFVRMPKLSQLLTIIEWQRPKKYRRFNYYYNEPTGDWKHYLECMSPEKKNNKKRLWRKGTIPKMLIVDETWYINLTMAPFESASCFSVFIQLEFFGISEKKNSEYKLKVLFAKSFTQLTSTNSCLSEGV